MAVLRIGMAANQASGGAVAWRCRRGISASVESGGALFAQPFRKFGIAQIQLALQLLPHTGQINASPHMIDIGSNSGLRVGAELSHQPLNLQPGRLRHATQHRVVAAPRPVLGQVADTCPHGVEHHVARQLQQIRLALHDDRFEPALKHMTIPVVGAVVSLGVRSIELAHSGAQVAVDGLHNDMKVVVHHAVGMAEPIVARAHLTQQMEPVMPVGVV